ncbi:MAG: DMT family transporter [Candidatus Saccharicenans sp.]|nr:DMT family transporter [Candidatus Saccharicenans sp.]MDI6848943.1 DMT family transporter [Candidatus Saccharicenans sp.]
MDNIIYSGEWLALASAVVWAVAVILFRISGFDLHPLGINLGKNLFALLLIILTTLITGAGFWPGAGLKPTLLLLLSGFLGIAVSDTLFLWTLKLIGASLTAIVDCVYAPFVIGLSYLFLDERLTRVQLLGVVMIVSAVVTISARDTDNGRGPLTRKNLFLGIILGVTAMAFVAVGIVIIKPVLKDVPVVWATGVRLIGGTLPLVLFPFFPARRDDFRPLMKLSTWKILAPASFLGTYLSLMFWIGGMKYTFASVASALNQLNTIFIFILATVFLKEKATTWRILAVALAFVGAFLATF